MASSPLRLIFMGTPDFAVPVLNAVHAAGHTLVGVYSQPPRAAGRGQEVRPSAAHQAGQALGIPVFTPPSLKTPEALEQFKALKPDLAVVASYGLILPQAILDVPRLGCLCIHVSLLPRWRGAAPVPRTLLAGDRETGVTIIKMDAGCDTGGVYEQQAIPVGEQDTSASLLHDLFVLGAKMAPPLIERIAAGSATLTPQSNDGATYAEKLTRADGLVDWAKPAATIERMVRALTPWPGVTALVAGEPLKILKAQVVPGKSTPGTLLDDQCTVACGQDALRLQVVQRAGRGPVDGGAFLRGARLLTGIKFENGQ